MWGSLTLAVKGVALSRGLELDGDEEVREYAAQLGGELRDRRIREAFGRIADFAQTAERTRRSRYGADRTAATLEDVASGHKAAVGTWRRRMKWRKRVPKAGDAAIPATSGERKLEH